MGAKPRIGLAGKKLRERGRQTSIENYQKGKFNKNILHEARKLVNYEKRVSLTAASTNEQWINNKNNLKYKVTPFL